MSSIYTQSELERILGEFNSNTPLYELGKVLGRSPYGIALKMRELSS